MNPIYPVYIVSKGRAEVQLTSKWLSMFGVDHYVIVERDQAADYYANRTRHARFLDLDPAYQDAYEVCDDLGRTKSVGPGAARNYAWDHAAREVKAPWHWVMDDNLDGFFRLNHNIATPVADGTIFRAMEVFSDRFQNLAIAGPAYHHFVAPRVGQQGYVARRPYVLNTRIYSCLLIRNDIPFRWRGRYNEDTDLSIRALKDGWCTVQFAAFLQNKVMTQTIGGGNTADFYAVEGTKPKSEMLERLHPDVAKMVWRFKRWHHVVDYGRFKTQLQLRPGVEIPDGRDNFGMVLEQHVDGEWIAVDHPTQIPTIGRGKRPMKLEMEATG